MEGVVMVLTTEQALDAFGILEGEDGIFIDDAGAAVLSLVEPFVRRPADRSW